MNIKAFCIFAALVLVVLVASLLASTVSAATLGPATPTPTPTITPTPTPPLPEGQFNQGINPGWVIGNDGSVYFADWVPGEIQAAGAGWVRVEFRLGHFERWDATSLQAYRQVLETAKAYNLRVLGIIDYASLPGTPAQWNAENSEVAHGDGTNQYQADFVNLAVRPIISELGGLLDAVEIWNEPNMYNYSPGADGSYLYPSIYSGLLKQSYLAIDAIRPSLPVLFGGLLAHDGNTGVAYFNNVVRRGKQLHEWGNTLYFDAFGYHLYVDQGRTTTQSRLSNKYYGIRSALNSWGGQSIQIWTTEAGWQSSHLGGGARGEELQAQNLSTLYQFGRAYASTYKLGPIFWYRLNDYSDGTTVHTWGLVSDVRKPAFYAFRRDASY